MSEAAKITRSSSETRPAATAPSHDEKTPLPSTAQTHIIRNPSSFHHFQSPFFIDYRHDVRHPIFTSIPGWTGPIQPVTYKNIPQPSLESKVQTQSDGFDFLIDQISPRIQAGALRIGPLALNGGKDYPRYSTLAVRGEDRPIRYRTFVAENSSAFLDAEFKKIRGVSRLVSLRFLFSEPLVYEIEYKPNKFIRFPVYGLELVPSPDGLVRADPILIDKRALNPRMKKPKKLDPELPLGKSAVLAYILKPESENLWGDLKPQHQTIKQKIIGDILTRVGYKNGQLFLLDMFSYEWGIDCKSFEEHGAPCHSLPTSLTDLLSLIRPKLDPEYAYLLKPKTYDPNSSYELNGKLFSIPESQEEVDAINKQLAPQQQIQCYQDEKTEKSVCNRGQFAAPTQQTSGSLSVVVEGGRYDLPYGLGRIFLEGPTQISVSYDPQGPAGSRVKLSLKCQTAGKDIRISRNDLKIEGYNLEADLIRSSALDLSFDPMIYDPAQKSKELPPFSLSFKNPKVENLKIEDPANGYLFVEKGSIDNISITHRYHYKDKKHVVHLKVQDLKSSGYARTHGFDEGSEKNIPFAISMSGSSHLNLNSKISWIEGQDRMLAMNTLKISGAVDKLSVKNNSSSESDFKELRFQAQNKSKAQEPIHGRVYTTTIFSRGSNKIVNFSYSTHLDFNNVGIELDGTIPVKINNIEAKTKIHAAQTQSLHLDIIASLEGWSLSTQEGKSMIQASTSSDLKILEKKKTIEATVDADIALNLHKIEYHHEKGLVEFDAGIHIDIGRQINFKEFLKTTLKGVLFLSNQKSATKTLPSIEEVTPDFPQEQKQLLRGNFLSARRIHYLRQNEAESFKITEALGSIIYGQPLHQGLLPPYEYVLFRLPSVSLNKKKKQLAWPFYVNVLLGNDGFIAWP